MVSRLSMLDAAYYRLQDTATQMYVRSLLTLRPPRAGFPFETLLDTVEQRLSQAPRYRQKIREVPMSLARPVWVDDREFDITYHVRHLTLSSPGSAGQLHALVSRLAGRPLDRSRPLWVMYLIDGLDDGNVALYVKSHLALVNGMATPALGQVLVDRTQRPPPLDADTWTPRREPGPGELLFGALGDWVSSPRSQLRVVGSTVGQLATDAGPIGWARRKTFDVARVLARGTAPGSTLNTQASRHRLFTVAQGQLDAYRAVRSRYQCNINDVVLAVITGALRNWLLSRGEPVDPTQTMRAMAPLSVYADHDESGPAQSIGEVVPFLVDLPVGEPNPVIRLSQIAYATESYHNGSSHDGGSSHNGSHHNGSHYTESHHNGSHGGGPYPGSAGLVSARSILAMSGFAPPTLHAMGVRAATNFAGFSGRVFNLLITNVPGAQRPLYVCGAKLLEAYNVPPLLPKNTLAIGVTSYNGVLYYGVIADRRALRDVNVVSALLDEALAELLAAVT